MSNRPPRRESLEVGNVGADVFIGCTVGYEVLTKPLTGQVLHTLRFHKDDVPWLIEALAKEISTSSIVDAIDAMHDVIEERDHA